MKIPKGFVELQGTDCPQCFNIKNICSVMASIGYETTDILCIDDPKPYHVTETYEEVLEKICKAQGEIE